MHLPHAGVSVHVQAALGSGSEMVVDVAPGVDWTAMVAILMAVQQVGLVAQGT